MNEYVPVYVGSVTKYVFVESPTITPHDIAIRGYEISNGVMIKETCFGLQVTGTPDEVERIVTAIRDMDRNHIFVKDRGFPPGDPRRCRANLSGARPGYYGHEFEISLIRYISHGLDEVDKLTDEELKEAGTMHKEVERIEKGLDIESLEEIIKSEES